MNFERTLEKAVERLNRCYEDELGDAEIVIKDLPQSNLKRLSIEPNGHTNWRSDLGQAGTEQELQCFIAGLEEASFSTIKTKSQPAQKSNQ